MKIEKISFQSKKNIFEFVLSSGAVYHISYAKYTDLDLHADDVISHDLEKILIQEDHKNRAKDCAITYALYKMRTEQEVRARLCREHFSEESIQMALQFLKDNRLLDDANYAKLYVADKSAISHWSRRKIQDRLLLKGITREIAEEALSGLDESLEIENLERIAQKKAARKNLSLPRDFDSCYRSLSAMGFSSEDILRVLKHLREEKGE